MDLRHERVIQLRETGFDLVRRGDSMAKKSVDELAILFTPGGELTDREIGWVGADSNDPLRRFRANLHGTFSPALRKHGGFGADAVSVVAERFMKGRPLADRAVDEVTGAFISGA